MQHVVAYHDPDHACNQGSLIKLANGELPLGYNQERVRVHADSGQSCLIKSADGGRTWDTATRRTVWPWSEHVGNWDCAFAQISTGEILRHTPVCSFMAPTALKGGADQIMGGPPRTVEAADGLPVVPVEGGEWPRVFVLRSDDGGNNWEYWATVAYDPAHILEWAEAGMTRLAARRSRARRVRIPA